MANLHRLFVFTDISSLTSGVREPDDGQSLVRLLCYANAVQIEGLAATSNLGHGQLCRPELLHAALDAYEADLPRLRLHQAGFPDTGYLRSGVVAGQTAAGPQVPLEECVGEGKETAASSLLIERADAQDGRPLWVAVWGGTADLAQALFTVRATRSAAGVARFLSVLRVHAIYDQDATAAWIKQEFPDLFYLTRRHAVRGMYRGGDTSLCDSAWVKENISPCGALGALYPDYRGGDIWGKVSGIKEGDTPSYLNLLFGRDPLQGWGGTFHEVAPNRWEDLPAPGPPGPDPDPAMRNVYCHRPAFQEEFRVRLSWLRK